jgi:hypothetical protein
VFIVKATGYRAHFDWDTNIQFIDIQQYLLDFISRSWCSIFNGFYYSVTFANNTYMRTTLNIDDELLTQAQQITGMAEKTALVREGLAP